MKIFKHHSFHNWAKSEGLTEDSLQQAIDEINQGLYETNLGSGLYKKRIAMRGHGKRGSYRTLVAFKTEDKAYFLYGFAKSVQANIDPHELKVYKKLAKQMLELGDAIIEKLVSNQTLIEVK